MHDPHDNSPSVSVVLCSWGKESVFVHGGITDWLATRHDFSLDYYPFHTGDVCILWVYGVLVQPCSHNKCHHRSQTHTTYAAVGYYIHIPAKKKKKKELHYITRITGMPVHWAGHPSTQIGRRVTKPVGWHALARSKWVNTGLNDAGLNDAYVTRSPWVLEDHRAKEHKHRNLNVRF